MATWPARIGRLTWNDATGVVAVEVQVDDAPPAPNDGNQWSAPTGSVLTFEVPARKVSTGAPTITKIQTSPDGFVLTRYTWNAQTQAWGSPVRVDQNGNPL